MWESRHGFPAPDRLPGGHRRYSHRDVEAVAAVARLRDQGLSLPAAIEQVLRDARPPDGSIFAGLREAHPDLQPIVLSKATLLAVTHAIEDESCARGADGLLVGSFQRARFYRQAQHRWREVARTAQVAVAIADFEQLRTPAQSALELPIEAPLALAREWTLVVDASAVQACLAAWELPSRSELPDRARRFEVLWSLDPQVVRSASQVAIGLLALAEPAVAARAAAALRDPVAVSAPDLRGASALVHRIVAYVGRLSDAAVPRNSGPDGSPQSS